MNVFGLNSNFETQTLLSPINIQWNRKYYDFGDFEILIPLNQYDENCKYIYLQDHNEIGIIQKVDYSIESGKKQITLSGFFAEKMTDDKITYPVYNGNNTAEYVAREIFSTYKSDLPITLGTFNNLGSNLKVQSTGSELGKKIFEILRDQELSFKVIYDFDLATLKFEVWQGLDRTQSQSVNNPVVFNSAYNGIVSGLFVSDSSNLKNYAVVGGEGEGDARIYYTADKSSGGYKKILFVDARDIRQEEYSLTDYQALLSQRGFEKLEEYEIEETMTAKISPEIYTYKTDYDLGDKVDIIFPDINKQIEARIISVYEVYKENQEIIEIELGNYKNLRSR